MQELVLALRKRFCTMYPLVPALCADSLLDRERQRQELKYRADVHSVHAVPHFLAWNAAYMADTWCLQYLWYPR